MLGRIMVILTALVCARSGAAAPDAPAVTYRFFVFNEPKPGQEAEYLRFYQERHLIDVVSIPGFVEGRRYVLSERQLAPKPTTPPVPRYLSLYTIRTTDLAAVKAEIARRLASGETQRSTTYDPQASISFTYREVGPIHRTTQPIDEASGPAGEKPVDYLHFVQTAAVAGREDEYNAWYTRHHLSDMIKTRGFQTSQRLELADAGRTAPPPARYAAIFTFHTADDAAVLAAYRAGASVRMPTDTADRDATRGYTFRSITPALTHAEAVTRKARFAK